MSRIEQRRSGIPVEEIFLIIMILLTLLGIAITDFSPPDAFMYWMVMIFVFGLIAMLVGWHKGKHDIEEAKQLFKIQSLHWLGSLTVVVCVLTFAQEGRMSLETASLVDLLILGLATFLDGVRIGWRFSLAGTYLIASSVTANYVENIMPWLFTLAGAIIFATIYFEKKRKAA